ncbi:RidA family protein [Paraburkholderia sediminicola]|uniref:RidA family protein n=1 Tax=Paraburkholderia sediminicola TaxID=458836 RepID=UPI0038B9BE8E
MAVIKTFKVGNNSTNPSFDIVHPENRLAGVGIQLPEALAPTGNYVPFRLYDRILYLSGHGPRLADNTYMCGQLSELEHVAPGYAAARLTALNMLATIKLAVGDLANVESVLKVFGMVNTTPDFAYHPQVINGFSDVFVEAFGDVGRHARSAIGMASLPHGMTVEIEAILLVKR